MTDGSIKKSRQAVVNYLEAVSKRTGLKIMNRTTFSTKVYVEVVSPHTFYETEIVVEDNIYNAMQITFNDDLLTTFLGKAILWSSKHQFSFDGECLKFQINRRKALIPV